MNQFDFIRYSSENFDFELYNNKIDMTIDNQFDFIVESLVIDYILNTYKYFDFELSEDENSQIDYRKSEIIDFY